MGDTAQQMSKEKWVYSFGGGSADGNTSMKNLLGGKGANLAEMARLGLPVPPGFTITTAVCTAYYDNGETYPGGLDAEVDAALKAVEADPFRHGRTCSERQHDAQHHEDDEG